MAWCSIHQLSAILFIDIELASCIIALMKTTTIYLMADGNRFMATVQIQHLPGVEALLGAIGVEAKTLGLETYFFSCVATNDSEVDGSFMDVEDGSNGSSVYW